MENPRLTIFWVAVVARLAARHQVPAPLGRRNQTTSSVVLFSSLQPFRRHHISQSTPGLAGSSLNKRQCLKATHYPSERVKFSLCDFRSAPTHFHNSPSPVICRFRKSIPLSSTWHVEQVIVLTRQRRYYFPGRSPTLLKDPNAHVYTLSIQSMIRKLVYLSFYNPQCGRCHRHYTPIATPSLVSDQRRISGVALHYLPPSLDSYPTTSPRAQISWIVSPFDTDRWDGFSRYLLCSGGRWRADRDGGSRLLLCVHNRRSWTVFE